MARRFSLEPLHALARDRLEAASQRMMQLKAACQEQESKLEQLRGFHAEYQRRLGQAIIQGLDMTRLRDYQVFIGKIDAAIHAQVREVAKARSRWEEAQRIWLEARRKLKTFDVLEARHRLSERRDAGRREQRDQDEHARKRHGARRVFDEGEP